MEIPKYFTGNLIELNIQLLELIYSLYVLIKYHRYSDKEFNDSVIGTLGLIFKYGIKEMQR